MKHTLMPFLLAGCLCVSGYYVADRQASGAAARAQRTADAEKLSEQEKRLVRAYRHYAQGNYQLAARQYQRMLHEYPDNQMIRLMLAVVYDKQGDQLRACTEYEKVLRPLPVLAAAARAAQTSAAPVTNTYTTINVSLSPALAQTILLARTAHNKDASFRARQRYRAAVL